MDQRENNPAPRSPAANRPVGAGRGAHVNPANRFEKRRIEDDFSGLAPDDEYLAADRKAQTEYLPDESQSIVTENDSPDVGFRFSLNPYRGCSHGCAYCYARPTHEYLGFSAGLDFETKVLVKHRAPELLRQWLARKGWTAEPIGFSGATDCYQPAEREFQLTRRCLEVARECRQPLGIVTKNALVCRDIDILSEMASHNTIHVTFSITTLDAPLARVMEPRTSTPAARLRAMGQLCQAGIPVSVLVAPVIPGLTDSEIPRILRAASEAGACSAAWTLLRLPEPVQPVFLEWLARTQPDRQERILARIRDTHGGKLTDSRFGRRMRGQGEIAEQIRRLFRVFAEAYHLDGDPPPLDSSQFTPPRMPNAQMTLF